MDDLQDNELISELYDQNKAKLFAAAYNILHHQQDAEDVLQDVFLKLVLITPRLRKIPPEKRTAFLICCVINRSKDIIRQRKARNEADLSETIRNEKAENEIQRIDQRDVLQRFLKTLDERQQAILIFHFGYGLGYRDIAAMMEMTPAAVQKTVSRLRRKMKEYAEECL